ncbi:MAG: DUF4416 family protein [Candidatus Omnitrophota bacterium]|nr:DUF4416 family protein [Candidatus Omnitrophota bacterium]
MQKKVKLAIGFIFKDGKALRKAELLVSKKFGPADFESGLIDFLRTEYYKDEFGENLKRKFISIERPANPENIYKVKLITGALENKISRFGKRTVNIDPGYITESKLILLTTKDYSHRVYLKKGVYAESTLRFQNGTFSSHETTYPDYKSKDYIKIFNDIRNLYRKQLKSAK